MPLLSARSSKKRRPPPQYHTLLPAGEPWEAEGGYVEDSVVAEGEEERPHRNTLFLFLLRPLLLFLFGGTGEQATGWSWKDRTMY